MKRVFVAAAFVLTGAAHAACTCACVNGQVRALCQNSLDLPPICAPQICPLVPPSIAPLPSIGLPPLGTQNCRNVQVWNGYQYVWRSVCS